MEMNTATQGRLHDAEKDKHTLDKKCIHVGFV
jgi:hypothetical protein